MKVIEILKLNKGMLKTCRKVGIRMEDVQYIELYNVCERKVYALIKRLQSDCNPFAV